MLKKGLTRRRFLKGAFSILFTILGWSLGGYVYAHNSETDLVNVRTVQIRHPLLPQSFNGIKMVQFSDTHLGFHYNLHDLTKLIQKINKCNPDIVFFTGDLMDIPNQYPEIHNIIPILQQIQAPLGKYCIYGNHDHGGYGTELYKNVMENAQFTLLLNEAKKIQLSDGSCIYILGIDDVMLGSPDFHFALKKVPNQAFKILLSHAPDLADQAAKYPIQWQLSGHSHGGQVKIPFIGPLVIPPFAQKYQEGYYRIGKLNLYVNRGLGTTRIPFRFMSKPELTIYTLRSVEI